MIKSDSKIYVAGHSGMVGSSICRLLEKSGYGNVIVRTSSELDLRDQQSVNQFFSDEKPEYVFLTAAKVGGIHANNTFRAEFIYDNLMIASNVIHAAYSNRTEKLLFLGSSCIYPKQASQPIREEYLMSGPLEPTNEAYAIAKISGLKLCQSYRDQYGCNFISLMPTNLYGPGDNYHPENSHVLPALIRKFHEAKENRKNSVELWGSGTPKREFLFADDLADACLFLMANYDDREPINIGSGEEISILDLAKLVKNCIGFEGNISWDETMPDGTPRKLLDCSKLSQLGWRSTTTLTKGIKVAYSDFLQNKEQYT